MPEPLAPQITNSKTLGEVYDLYTADPVKKRDKRRPFSIEQLQRIFHSPLYTGCVDDVYGYAKTGDARPRRARFWIPIIALFSGMRMNEICQLKVGDIRTLDGVQCFVVIEDGDMPF